METTIALLQDTKNFELYSKHIIGYCYSIKNDEIKWSLDDLDKNDLEIFGHIISDFKIVGAIKLFSNLADPEGKCTI